MAEASFSISDAALEGFETLRRHWRVVAGWGLFNLLALVGGSILLVILLIAVVPFVSSRDAAGAAGAILGGLLIGVGGLIVEAMVQTAIYRLMLRPDAPGFLHLRLGKDELRVVAAILLTLLAAVPAVAVAGLGVALAGRVSPMLAVGAAVVLLIAAYAWMLRFALTPVIAFEEGRLNLLEAWRRTSGQTWRLLAMAVLLFCVVAMIAVVAWIVVFVLGGLLTGFHDLALSDAETVAQHPGRYIFQLVVQMLLVPAFLMITQAPWVAVYRALKPS